MSTAADVEVRLAVDGERRACRLLLAEAARRHELGEVWGAWETSGGEAPRLVGALSVQPVVHADGGREAAVWGRVVRTHRRRGIGARLFAVACDESRRLGVATLRIISDADAGGDSPDVAFLAARGFAVAETLSTFEVATASIHADLEPLAKRMTERGMIPAEARMVPLREAPLRVVARLHAAHLGGTEASVLDSIAERLARDDADDHGVLLIDGEVHGLLFGTTVDGVTTIDAEVLSPTCRVSGGGSGWASLFMLAERLAWGLRRGSRSTRFSCTSGNRPTRRLAKRLGAREVGVETVYRRNVEGR